MQDRRRLWRRLLFAAALVVLALAGLAVFLLSRLADLRPPELIEAEVSAEHAQHGRELLARMEDAHGGYAAWASRTGARVEFRDHWPRTMMRALAMPWADSGLLMRSTMLRAGDASRLEFLEGADDGTAWGIQQWRTYRVGAGAAPVFEDDDDIRFWLPTFQYFFEAPFRLREADVVADAGPATVAGVTYQRVFATWGGPDPQPRVDQYLAWIDPESGRLEYLEYTVRDMMPAIAGCLHYRDYRQVEELQIAMTMAVVEGPGGPDALHRFELEDVRLEDVPRDFVVPRPELSRAKYQE